MRGQSRQIGLFKTCKSTVSVDTSRRHETILGTPPMPIMDYYVTTDAMGSVMAVLDEAGNVLERRSYDAFGQVTFMLPDGTVVADSPTGVEIGFQGQQIDELTGMYQMGYRWYSPLLGRWVSQDPIGLAGGVNICEFSKNCPTVQSDSSGLLSASNFLEAIKDLVLSIFRIHVDNLSRLPLYLNDPEVHCFNEGWFRHCVNSCILQTRLDTVSSRCLVSIPYGMSVQPLSMLSNACIVQAVAMTAGNDWPLQTGNDPGDVNANFVGIVQAIENGPSVSCISSCRSLFYTKRKLECCASKPHIKKDDPRCC